MCRSIPAQKNGTGSTALKFNLIVVRVCVSYVNIYHELVVPAWTAGTQVDMDVSGRILRAWMPAIRAGMTAAADGKML